ncbi:MAG: hypothetical protein ACOZE5_02070 [Verrucomicrobiota bacterium]
MKTLTTILLLGALLLAGCESTAVSERFAAVPPQVHAFNGGLEAVHRAALRAFKRLDFTVTRSTMGRLEAASAINTSETFGDSRQIVARVKISEVAPGKSEVELTVSEEVSSPSMGGTRQRALREHGFYQAYFAALQQVLHEMTTEEAVEKN